MQNETPMRIGLIGFGAIGQGIVQLLAEQASGTIEVVATLVRDPSRARERGARNVVATVDEVLAARPEVVVEAGGHGALRTHGPAILHGGCDLFMISIGALADPETEWEIVRAAQAGGSRATVLSGAIGGLDALAAAAVGGLTRVTHTTRKPAKTLLSGADGSSFQTTQELFRGSARAGALAFPESINVAAAVSLAGIGFDRTEVCVLADPTITRNQHEIVAEGAFGTLRIEICNVPTETNPRTGRLVAMSAVQALRQRRSPLVVG